MLDMLPVRNCMHFVTPTSLDMWSPADVPGIVGVLRRDDDGQYTVIDAFGVENLPVANAMLHDRRFAAWIEAAGGIDRLRFDAFMMPLAPLQRRADVVTLLQRSCGFRPLATPAYAHAV
jgi:hypothetical protein